MTPQCPFTEQLSVYHDGELDDVSRRGLEAHLPNCPACRGQLAQWDRLSQVIGSAPKPEPTVQEIARIHQAAMQVPNWNEMGKALRLGGFLLAAAASVLIICGVWLMEFPAASPKQVVFAPRQPAEWELTAINLSVEPRSNDRGLTRLAGDARVINWMAESLHTQGRYSQP